MSNSVKKFLLLEVKHALGPFILAVRVNLCSFSSCLCVSRFTHINVLIAVGNKTRLFTRTLATDGGCLMFTQLCLDLVLGAIEWRVLDIGDHFLAVLDDFAKGSVRISFVLLNLLLGRLGWHLRYRLLLRLNGRARLLLKLGRKRLVEDWQHRCFVVSWCLIVR